MEQNIELDQEAVIIQQGEGAVNSVNGQTGDVVLTTSDLENTSDYQTGSEVQSAIDDAVSQIDIPTNVSELTNDANYQDVQQVATAVAGEASLREAADTNLQGQIDAISASSDVTDIVGTYADLQNYDTSTLGNNDIIKVLQDESRNDETTYYRWSTTTQSFTLIGEEGPYYTKSQADGRFVAQTTYTTDKAALEADIATKQDELTAGNNVQISGNVISATDTTYSDFTGTDGQTAGTAGLVPAPATTDAGKFLKADGTWDTAGSAINVVQTTGTSTTDVMSQDATTKTIFGNGQALTGSSTAGTVVIDTANGKSYDASNSSVYILPRGGAPIRASDYQKKSVYIGADTSQGSTTDAVGVGIGARAGQSCTAIGSGAIATSSSVVIGRSSNGANTGVAIGGFAQATGTQSIAIGSGGNSVYTTEATASQAIAIGGVAKSSYTNSVALGYYSSTSRAGEVNVGTPGHTYGYNSTAYRVIGGVHPAVDDHDAVNLEQMNARVLAGGTAAPTTSTVGEVGTLYAYVESGTGHLAICTDDTGGTYTWQTLV